MEFGPKRETAWFTAVTLAMSWTLGALWLEHPERWQLIQWMMATPAVVGFACAWYFRREPPRAAGFRFTGWAPWAIAMVYPLFLAAVAVGIGYTVRFARNDSGFIVFHPERLLAHGFRPVLSQIAVILVTGFAPWLAIALFYRFDLPTRLERVWRPLGLLAPVSAWIGLLLFSSPGSLAPPGILGEELGWRGFLVRRWKHSPRTALLVGMPIWAAFHVPFICSVTQRGHFAQNATFLASIAAAAPVFAALYLWSESVWPCAVFHFSWNLWNPLLLGDVYHGDPGLFGGAVWFFNGEGICGMLINGALSLWLVRSALGRERA